LESVSSALMEWEGGCWGQACGVAEGVGFNVDFNPGGIEKVGAKKVPKGVLLGRTGRKKGPGRFWRGRRKK